MEGLSPINESDSSPHCLITVMVSLRGYISCTTEFLSIPPQICHGFLGFHTSWPSKYNKTLNEKPTIDISVPESVLQRPLKIYVLQI